MKPQSGRNMKKKTHVCVCVCSFHSFFALIYYNSFFPTLHHCDFILWWHRNQGETLEEMCVCSFHGLYFNGGRAHYIIESKVQWKPFCRATQQYPQDDWLGGKFPYTMTYAHGSYLIATVFFFKFGHHRRRFHKRILWWNCNHGETLEIKLCLYVGLCLSVYLCLCFCYSVRVWLCLCEWVFGMFSNGSGAHYSLILVTPFAVVVKKKNWQGWWLCTPVELWL